MHYKRKKCRRFGSKSNTGNHKKVSWDYTGGIPYNRQYNKYRKFDGWDDVSEHEMEDMFHDFYHGLEGWESSRAT